MGYRNTHKAYRLVDVDTNKVNFGRDFMVDKDARPLHITKRMRISKDESIMAQGSSVNIHKTPLEGERILSMSLLMICQKFQVQRKLQVSQPTKVTILIWKEQKKTKMKRPKWWHGTIRNLG